MAVQLETITRSIRGFKDKARGKKPTPLVVNAYGCRAVTITENPYNSVDIHDKPESLKKMRLASCLQELDPKYEDELSLRTALCHIDALRLHPQDLLWRRDQLDLLASALGVNSASLLELAQNDHLLSGDNNSTPDDVLTGVVSNLEAAEKIIGKPKAEEIKAILTARYKEMLNHLYETRTKHHVRIGQACMRIASGGPENLLHRVILNTRIGHAFTQALDVVWRDVIWVLPTEVYVPGARGNDYMQHFWLRLYETGIYGLFAFEDKGAIEAYWRLRQGGQYRAGLEIPQEYLDNNLQIISPLDPNQGSIGLKQEFNLSLCLLGVPGIPRPDIMNGSYPRPIKDFEVVMLNGLEMPEVPFTKEQITY